MQITIENSIDKRSKADLLVIPFWNDQKKIEPVADIRKLKLAYQQPLELGDFTAKDGEVHLFYAKDHPEKRIVLLGLGAKEKLTTETLRRCYAQLSKYCQQKKLTSLNLVLPQRSELGEQAIVRGVVEGIMLANYQFVKHKRHSVKETPPVLLKSICLAGASKEALTLAKKYATICEGVYMARDLANSNADEITPKFLAAKALEIAASDKRMKATIFDKKRIEKEEMGLLLAVNRGSHHDPAFIILEYKGSPKAKEHTVLIGKGITYDTGGLNIKTSNMETMKADMAGAAMVLATLSVASKLNLPIHLTGVIPATENAVSSMSYKPGDVYVGYSGKSVEITNTDAEGRLVLGDALAYVEKELKPTRMIDFATLTGGVDVALGSETSGMMTNNDVLANQFQQAGSETFERVWRLPLFEEYKDSLRSDVGDMKNAPSSRSASPIIAAIFLQHFVQNTPWAHFDIASTAMLGSEKRYHPKGATGIGVRLMIEFLMHL